MLLGLRHLAAVSATTLLLATLGACGSDEEPEGPLAKGSKSASPSAAAKADPTAPPAPEAGKDTAQAREDFARWFVDAFAYAFATNDVEPIMEVAATEERVRCSTCEAFAEFIDEREAEGITLQPSAYTVKKVFETGKVRDVRILTLVTDRPAYANVDEDGNRTDPAPRDRTYPIEVGLRWHQGKYELTGWKAGEGNKETS